MLKKRLVLLSLTVAVSAWAGQGKQSFNEGWRFHKGDVKDAQQAKLDDSQWRRLNLPHDWAIEGPFDKQYNARAGGLPFHGIGWYRKSFQVPAELKGKRIYIDFDGAMNRSEVWINDQFLGFHPYGYTGFRYDLTPHLKYGDKENVIAVKLAPEDLSSRWYPGAGLYRHVWLDVRENVHVDQWGVFVTTPEVSSAKAKVQVEVTIRNTTKQAVHSRVKTLLKAPCGKVVATGLATAKVPAGKVTEATMKMNVTQPELWDIHNPVLYECVTIIVNNDGTQDKEVTPFGIRSIEYSAEKGFVLNGRRVQMNGVCMHHDLGPLGAAVNRRATERQLEIMKSMGVNAIRTSHNPPSPEQLEFCDKLGLLVQDEAFDCWEMAKTPNGYNKYFEEWHERDLRGMIKRDRNHPSVVMWSIGNEILEQKKKDGWKLARKLTAICHDEDDSRPVSAGFNNYPGSIKNGLAAEVDIPGFNYKPRQYAKILEQHPDWIIAATETSSCVSSRGVYHLPIEKYKTHESMQVTSYDLIGPPWAYPPEIEFDALEKSPKVLGEFVWTGFDYLGEPTPYGGRDNSTNGYWNADWPVHSSFFGAVDLCGFPKDRYYLYQSQWTTQPMIHVLPHWNWEGREGEPIPVYCYTNCDAAELIVNGVSQGKRVKGVDKTALKVDFIRWEGGDFDSKYRLRWDVPFQPGSIKVVGYRQGQVVCQKEIRTAQKAAKVTLIPDRQSIKVDGEDLCFIAVRIEDGGGQLCPIADNQVRFEVEGAGILEAVGNGNPASLESFQADRIKAFSGQCLLIVRSKKGQAGKIRIKAISRGLKTGTTEIYAGYAPCFDSLSKHPAAPEWLKDAKLGIYFHWGVYSVPAFGSEWYPRNMYLKNRREYKHHLATYGDPAEYGYHEFVPQFKAEHFDAQEWAELFKAAGARFAGPVSEHHDGFAMWDSKVTPWNSLDMGPKRDITGEMAEALRAQGMKVITTFHHARNSLWEIKPGQWTGHYSGVKNDFPSLLDDPKNALLYGYIPREDFVKLWMDKLVEVIDQYQPDIIWFDSWLHEIPEEARAGFSAYYLNEAINWGKDVAIIRKQNDLPLSFSMNDHEKSREPHALPELWMTDDTLSTGSWCYTRDLKIKSQDMVLHSLIDTTSKNGVLLLNISPKADGSIPQDQRDSLLALGAWLKANGESIYDTRPWRIAAEGPTAAPTGGFKNHRAFLKLKYSAADIRYTATKDGKTVYAILMGIPKADSKVTLTAFADQDVKIASVSVVSTGDSVSSSMNDDGLVLTVPQGIKDKHAVAFKIKLM